MAIRIFAADLPILMQYGNATPEAFRQMSKGLPREKNGVIVTTREIAAEIKPASNAISSVMNKLPGQAFDLTKPQTKAKK